MIKSVVAVCALASFVTPAVAATMHKRHHAKPRFKLILNCKTDPFGFGRCETPHRTIGVGTWDSFSDSWRFKVPSADWKLLALPEVITMVARSSMSQL